MQQADTRLLIPKATTIFNRVIHFFDSARFPTPQPDQGLNDIDWPDSDLEPKQPNGGIYKQPFSGGYNEAYIIQYWTSYHLR